MALKDIPDSWLFRALRWLPKLLILGASILLLGASVEFWLFELFVSYVPQAMIIASGIYLVLFSLYARFIIRDGWHRCKTIVGWGDIIWLSSSFVLLLGILFWSLTIVEPTQLANGNSTPLRVASYNRWVDAQQTGSAGQFLNGRSPEIFILQEVYQEQADEFASALGLPFSYSTDCGCSADDSDVFILSKYPLRDGEKVFEYANGVVAKAIVEHPSIGDIAVFGVHLPVPFVPEAYNRRLVAYDQLASAIDKTTEPIVMMGDFNTTIFSPNFRNFLSDTERTVEPVVRREWPQCSWHGFGDILCNRIDHMFVSKGTSVSNFEVGQYIGSDHRPIIATLQF